MRFRILSGFLILFAGSNCAFGQTDSEQDTLGLFLRIKNISFFRDNEYSNPITEGYTLPGFIIQPSLVYFPGQKISVSLGVQLQGYSGTTKIKSPILIFNTAYRISKGTLLMLGTLDGSEKHKLDDPLFYRERMYTAQTESGLRLATQNSHFFNDLWINWENFVSRGDTTREIFVLGESFRYFSPVAGNFSIEIPVQVLFRHLGGQVSNYPEHVETFFDGNLGIKLNWNPFGERPGRFSLEYRQFRFQYISKHGVFAIGHGDASWTRLSYTVKNLMFGTAIWSGHDFYAPEGNPIYSSVSERTPSLIVHDRKIWTNSAEFTLLRAGFLELYLSAESYYDLSTHHVDAAVMLHLKLDKLTALRPGK
jgi:hypothetical protein